MVAADDLVAAPANPDAKTAENDPALELLVFGNVHKIKRSELIEKYDLGGLSDQVIISVAQKQMAADQRLAEPSRLRISSVLARHAKRRR